MAKTTLVVGAGATIAEAKRLHSDPLPPLDRDFFSRLSDTRLSDFLPIAGYMKKRYGVNIADPPEDSLEAVMSTIYADVRHSQLGPQAATAFRALIRAVNAELAISTNKMDTDAESHLCRVVRKLMGEGTSLDEIAFVTFNYDLQIEKALEALERDGVTTSSGVALNFPHCYHLLDLEVTGPTRRSGVFAMGDKAKGGVPIFKLHGSLNWYSTHNSRNPSIGALLRTSRTIRITARHEPSVGMTLGGARKSHTYPVVIPPVLNKSAILPDGFFQIWTDAERHLAQSEEVVMFGYSCPAFDLEAANLMARSLRGSAALRSISIIDPNPEVMTRYARLCRAERIAYYESADAYLT